MISVLVTDGENRSALAVARSLGRAGCRVVVAGHPTPNLASTSKYCSLGLAVPDPLSESVGYLTRILKVIESESIDYVFPISEQSIHLLNSARDQLPSSTVLACPPEGTMQAVSSKVRLCQLAESLAVPVPRSLYLQGRHEISSKITEIPSYPVVIKPAFSRTLEGGVFIPGAIRYASSPEELLEIYSTYPVLQYPSMIQEKIVGPGTGLFTLYDGDRHLALFSHRRLREKPPTGGVSVLSESVPLDDEMVASAGRLLSAVGWKGVAMVEFKRDNRDGKAKLMEINGRFWGSLQLAIACGVDFPVLLLDYLHGREIQSLPRYTVGHRLKWFFGTLDHLLIRLKHSADPLNSQWRAVIDFLKIFERNTSFDVFDRRDPRPFLQEARSYLGHSLKN